DDPSLQFGVNNFSFSFWVKPQNAPTRIAKKTGGANNGYWAIDFQACQKVQMEMRDENGHLQAFASDQQLPLGEWSHVVISVNRVDNEIDFIVNGINQTDAISSLFTGNLNMAN